MSQPPEPPPETNPPAPEEECIARVGQLTVHAEKVIIGKEEEKTDPGLKRRYLRNAGGFALFTFMVVLWFQLHLNTWATQKLVFGAASIWAVWQLLLSATKKDFASDAEETRKRLLGHKDAGELIAFACFTTVALLVFTSSVYVKLDDHDVPKVRIDVLDGRSKSFMDSIILEPNSRVDGRLFFPRFATANLTVAVVDPPGYEYTGNPIVLRPWTAVELTFADPTQFRKKKLHAIRIVPGWTLNGMDAPGKPPFQLTVTIGKENFTVSDCRFQTTYLGVNSPETLARIIREQTNEHFNDELNNYLTTHPGWEGRDDYLTAWRDAPRKSTTRDFKDGETVVASFGLVGKPPSAKSSPVTISPDEITTIFVERQSP